MRLKAYLVAAATSVGCMQVAALNLYDTSDAYRLSDSGRVTIKASGACKFSKTIPDASLVVFTYEGQKHSGIADMRSGDIYLVLQRDNSPYVSIKQKTDYSEIIYASMFSWDRLTSLALSESSACYFDGIGTVPAVNITERLVEAGRYWDSTVKLKSKLVTYNEEGSYSENSKWMQAKFKKTTVSVSAEFNALIEE